MGWQTFLSLLKEPDLKQTQALELIILKYFLSFKESQLKWNLGSLQMVIGVREAVVTQVGFALGVLMSANIQQMYTNYLRLIILGNSRCQH